MPTHQKNNPLAWSVSSEDVQDTSSVVGFAGLLEEILLLSVELSWLTVKMTLSNARRGLNYSLTRQPSYLVFIRHVPSPVVIHRTEMDNRLRQRLTEISLSWKIEVLPAEFLYYSELPLSVFSLTNGPASGPRLAQLLQDQFRKLKTMMMRVGGGVANNEIDLSL